VYVFHKKEYVSMSKAVVSATTANPWRLNTERIVIAGVLVAITIIIGVVPILGFIPVPSLALNATTEHIPTIIGADLGGPIVGMITGLFFGLMSYLHATIPLFKDPLVAFVPRILIGLTSWLTFAGLRRISLDLAAFLSGIIGGATNTVFVLTFGILRQDAPFAHVPPGVIIISVLPQAIAEAVIAGILALLVTRAYYIVKGRTVRAADTKPREELPY
jgi:uncharacterized membrane protein